MDYTIMFYGSGYSAKVKDNDDIINVMADQIKDLKTYDDIRKYIKANFKLVKSL